MNINKINYVPLSNFIAKKDNYACLKIMHDTSTISNFFENIFPKKNFDTLDVSKIYKYYNMINSEFSHLEYKLSNNLINESRFSNDFIEICEKYNLNFDTLLDLSNRISLLGNNPNKVQLNKFIKSLT
mgnify:CR=1 FL=1